MSDPLSAFLAYSHKDESLLDDLKEHLSPLRREKRVEVWHDREIRAGQDWEREIDDRLDSSRLILLLVSSSFIASEYCYGQEMTRALEREANGSAIVIPIIVRPVDWHNTPLGRLQATPKNGRAVTSWPDRDEAWTDVAREVRRAIDALSSPGPATSRRAADASIERPAARSMPTIFDLQFGDRTFGNTIGPKRAKLLCEIVNAFTSTSADDTRPIDGRGGDGGSMLFHPGLSGRNIVASIDDLKALDAVRLISMIRTGGPGDCEITPELRGIEYCRVLAEEEMEANYTARGGNVEGSQTLPSRGINDAAPSIEKMLGDPPFIEQLRQMWEESTTGQRSRRACLNLLGVGSGIEDGVRYQANLRIRNEGEHVARDVQLSLFDHKLQQWVPREGIDEIPPGEERTLPFIFKHPPVENPPRQQRHDFPLRISFRDGRQDFSEIEYDILFVGPGRDWEVTISRDNTRVDELCPPQNED